MESADPQVVEPATPVKTDIPTATDIPTTQPSPAIPVMPELSTQMDQLDVVEKKHATLLTGNENEAEVQVQLADGLEGTLYKVKIH